MTILATAPSSKTPSDDLVEIFESVEGEVEYESAGKVYMTFPDMESFETFKNAAEVEGIQVVTEMGES